VDKRKKKLRGGNFYSFYAFARLSSRSSREFMEKFLMVAPCPVRCVQTDNGSEFAGEFEDFPRNSTREGLSRAIPEDYPRTFHRCTPA
jgi:hypothetical protein